LERLMDRRRYAAVAEFARAALEQDPGQPEACSLLLQALESSGQIDEVASVHYDAAVRALEQHRRHDAVLKLCMSIQAAPDSPGTAWRMERLLQTADAHSQADLDVVAGMYGDLKRRSTTAASAFESLARRVKRSLWRRLPTLMLHEHQRIEVKWQTPRGVETITASELAGAVARGDRDLVEQFRIWAANQHGESRQTALQAIEGANAFLPGARRALSGCTRRILVDGSNVAWFGCSVDGGPDPDNIRHVRQKLLEDGFFPVHVIGDAALPFQVSTPERILRWELCGEITLVEGRTDADEVLLQEARRWRCPIITNDQMRDLDPDGDCDRIGYSIGPGGVVLQEMGETRT
jgi:hypothetical protein